MNNDIIYPVTVKIPAIFYSDHLARECGKSGVILSKSANTFTVSLDLDAFKDLYSDAEYYADMKSSGDYSLDDNKRICDSATRTLARLNKITN